MGALQARTPAWRAVGEEVPGESDRWPGPTRPIVARSRYPDGSIACSLPGCGGIVGGDFVVERADGYIGLCPRFELHTALASVDPSVADVWVDLKADSDQARRAWRSSQGRDNGSIICSLPGCEGVVSPAFVTQLDGTSRGLCPQRELHELLARQDSRVRVELLKLQAEQREAWALSPASAGAREQLLDDGGIPCSVPGCVGIVSVDYVLDTPQGEIGICGLWSVHQSLAESDPSARSELERLLALRSSLRDSWRTSGSSPSGGQLAGSADFDDLPF
jgi:hypothetical protein